MTGFIDVLTELQVPFVRFTTSGSPVEVSNAAYSLLGTDEATLIPTLGALARALYYSPASRVLPCTVQTSTGYLEVRGVCTTERVRMSEVIVVLATADRMAERAVLRDYRYGTIDQFFTTRQLTPREKEIAALLSTGLPSPRIAAELSISVHTVRRHTERIFAKLGVRTRFELAKSVGQLAPG